jgi:hypothetical protein
MQTEIVEKIATHVTRLSAEQQEEVLEFVQKFDPPHQTTLWDAVKDLVADIPDDVLDKLPTDGSENHDHYLYGAPKK